jgi:phage tail-like protein
VRALPENLGLGAASVRRYLRGNLPAVYSEGPAGQAPPVMGLLEGLEQVLDPIVILLDNLASHLQPANAPVDMVDLLLAMSGAPVDPTLPIASRRQLACQAAAIARSRGTKAGLQLTLTCAFPELGPEVRDHGDTTWAGAEGQPPAQPSPASEQPPQGSAFEVLLAQEPNPSQQAQLTRCIADHLPLGATYELTVAGG